MALNPAQVAALRNVGVQNRATIAATAHGDFGPILLPPYNPMVRPYNHNANIRARYEAWVEEDFEEAFAIAQKLEINVKNDQADRNKQLLRAYDTHLKSPWLMGRHVDDEVRRITLVFIARHGYLDEYDIRQALIACVHVNTSNYLEMRSKAIDHSRDAQSETCSYFLQFIIKLVEITGGSAVWEEASPSNIKEFLAFLFNQAPITACRLAFSVEKGAVDFEGVFATTATPRHRAWQTAFRTKFVALGYKTWEERVQPEVPNKAAVFKFWRFVMRSEAIRSLNLGPVADVPTLPSRSAGRTRPGASDDIPEDVELFA